MGIHITWDNDLDKKKGAILEPTSPFKGICQHCKQRKIVRNYAYNFFERLGTLCNDCFNEIDNELEDCLDFHEIEEFFE